MIKEITLQNFESHKDSSIKFDPGVNIILGETDNGKSSLIRSLRWVIFNEPSGDGMRSWWGGETKVKLSLFSSDDTIERIKTNSDNVYILNKSEFRAFGNNVPDEIKDVVNMDKTNLQLQNDSHFLLSNTSGQVALFFNKIANLDKIDIGLASINKSIREINYAIKFGKDDVIKYEKSLEQFDFIPALESSVKVLENLENERAYKKFQLDELVECLREYEEIIEKKQNLHAIIKPEKTIDKLLKLVDEKELLSTNYVQLKKLSIRLFYVRKNIKEAENIISVKPYIDSILELYEKHKKHLISHNILSKLYKDITELKTTQEKQAKMVKKLEKEFHANFPDVCPLCDQKIK